MNAPAPQASFSNPRHNFGPLWSDERVEALKALVNTKNAIGQPLSASEIAAELNSQGGSYTRNAIIGKLHRLGITTGRRHGPQILKPRLPRAPRQQTAPVAIKKLKLKYTEPKFSFDEQIPLEQRKTLVDLERHHCHWPVGEPTDPNNFFYCGGEVWPGQPYCETHCLRAYTKPARRGS